MSEQININLTDNTSLGGGPSSERRSPRGTGATAPPEREGGIRVGATAQDQNFESLGEGVGKGFLSPPVLTFLSILADSSTTIRKLFLPLRKLAQVQQNVLEQNNRLAQRSNRNLKFNQTGKTKTSQSRRVAPEDTGLGKLIATDKDKGINTALDDWFKGKTTNVLTKDASKKQSGGGVSSVSVGDLGKMGPKVLMAAKIATGIGVALIGFKLGLDLVRATFKLLNNAISSFIGKVRKYSVAVASAEAQASATRAFAAVQAGQISGQSASTVIQSKSKLEIAILSLQTTVTNVFGPSLAKLIDLGSSIVTFIERMLVDIKPITDLAVLFMNYIMDGLMVIIEWMDIGFVSDAKTALSSFLNLNSGVQGLVPTSDLFFSPGTADTAKKQFFDLWKP